MSIYNRDYMREERGSGGAGHPRNWSVVAWLLAINVGIYVLNNLLFYSPRRDVFALSLDALSSLRLWTPLTYQFVHANLWHLLGNMLGLFFLGRMLMDLVGPRKVLFLYLFGGFAGGFLQLAYNAAFGPNALVIGASASVLSIIIALATLIPQRRINFLLFFIIPISLTLRQVALLILAVNGLTLLFGFTASGGGGIAVMAHFGGMLFGWAYVRLGFHEPTGGDRASFLSRILDRIGVRVIPTDKETETESFRRERRPFVTSDVDAILDKINEHGFQSLTEEERQILEKGGKKLSRRIDRDS